MRRALIVASCLAIAAGALTVRAQERAGDGATYDAAGRLQRPADYRGWVFLTSGLGMTYGPAATAAGREPNFDNVFVNPESYRAFMKTGRWPDKTQFILEIRRSVTNESINNGGRTQGAVVAIESAVKDLERFPDGGWGYFDFAERGTAASAAPLPATASCYACHRNNTAVEHTFVQFYPALFDVAKKMGTVKPTYDPAHKVSQ